MTAIHSSAPYASSPPAFAGKIPGTTAQSTGGFRALLQNSTAELTPEQSTATPGSPKKDAKPAKTPGNQPDTASLSTTTLPVRPNDSTPFRMPLSFGSATDPAETKNDTKSAVKNGSDEEASTDVTDSEANGDGGRTLLTAVIPQTNADAEVVSSITAQNPLQAKPALRVPSQALPGQSASQRSASSANAASQNTANQAALTPAYPAQPAKPVSRNASNQTASDQATSNQAASNQAASNQAGLTQPYSPQATPVQLPIPEGSVVVPESLSPTQSAITSSLDEPQVEVNPRQTGAPGELAFALRLRRAESTSDSDPTTEASDSEGSAPAVPSVATQQPALPATESRETDSPGNSDKSDKQINSSVSARTGHTAESETLPAANTVNPTSGAGSGAQQNSDGERHLPGNRNAASYNTEQAEPQRTTASTELATVHGQNAAGTGAAPGGLDAPASAAPRATTTAPTSAPAQAAPAQPVEDNPAVGPAQQISLSVSSANDQKVEIRLMERAGEILVSVRTPDQTLAHSLRDDLGSLTGKLNQSGYSTETLATGGSGASNLSGRDSGNRHGASDDSESDGGQKQSSGQRQSGQEQQSRQDGRGKRPAWLEELNHSMASRQPNRSNSWQHL